MASQVQELNIDMEPGDIVDDILGETPCNVLLDVAWHGRILPTPA